LSVGTHTFAVRGLTSGGVVDATPATYTWTITAPPQPPVLTGVVVTPSVNRATIVWTTTVASDSRIDYGTSASSLSASVSNSSMVTSHSLTITGLTAGRTYYFRLRSRDAGGLSGYSPSATGTSSFVTRTQVSQAPASVTIQTGSYRSGSASSLSSNDGTTYRVNSTTSGTRTATWYGSFTNVSNALATLRVTYSGAQSRSSVTQKVEIYNWTTGQWVLLNSRSVGTSEVLVSSLDPSGTDADYVSGTSGSGELRVRVRSTHTSGSFYTIADYLRITFDRP
jgi:hypothetical protein